MTSPIPSDWDGKRSRLSALFSMPDNVNKPMKMNAGLVIGMKAGFAGSVASALLTPYMSFGQLLYQRKKWCALHLTKGFAIGAFSGFLYVGTVQQVSRLRGDKDDWINHFAGAFGAIFPYTIFFKQTWRFFLIGGTIFATAAAVAKLGAQTDLVDKMYMVDRNINQHTRYPEVYLHQQALNDLREEKLRKKYLSE